jgi:mannose/fructose/N-acetylgalactosamine-specific phosphotransferase system component IIC
LGYLVLALVAGLAAVERKGFLQAMLSRPIALAPLAGWALGDVNGGLLVAAPLELLWLGAVNLGAALPVHEALGTAAIAGGAVLAGRALGGTSPEIAILAVLICAPLALLGRKAERLVELWNERLAARAEAELAVHHARAAIRINWYGLLLPFAIAAVLAPVGAAAAELAIPAFLRAVPSSHEPLRVGFHAFAALACASGAKALRARTAPLLFFVALAAGLAAFAAWGRPA